ncbi:MAG: diguanylate cyclase [Candidatus Electryonea clarkiae]|nr:diguanylate cyclase [Candidatus Electryonea clarkiae]
MCNPRPGWHCPPDLDTEGCVSPRKLLDKFSLSLGVTCLPDHGNDARTLLRAVGQALYRAKKEERDRVVAA